MVPDDSETGDQIHGTDTSYWVETTADTSYERLDSTESVETAILGGGIVGITAAYHLTRAGQNVAVLERDRLVTGTTGHTTAKLTSLHGLPYRELVERRDERHAQQYATANERAIDDVETIAQRHDIDCDFERLPAVTYVSNGTGDDRIRDEVSVARQLGLPASYTESTDLPIHMAAGVRFADQAQFHPRKFLLGLATEIAESSGQIYEETPATDVSRARDQQYHVETPDGTVRAEHVVVATHFPIVDKWAFFARVYPKQSYVLAVTLSNSVPDAMYYRPGNSYFSVRPLPDDAASTALVGGQNHRTGHGGETRERYRNLEREARNRFEVESVDYRWSTQDFVSIDGVPFVGTHQPFGNDAYVATGFGGWGMTNGIAAGRILADSVLGHGTPWQDVYRPSRLTIDGTLREFVSHNTKSVRHLFEEYLDPRRSETHEQVPRGAAKVLDSNDGPIGMYRDEAGERHAVSAICTHMGCVVNWNDAERSWDCPCHGSRFDIDGTVIDTPAIDDLESYSPEEVADLEPLEGEK